ncbi:MAG: hypothetical protein HC897_07405 [Thermoanaerobaculia bacterium]|nr:hypothetical protein [Thermoanaerobaculia bacterium]
MSWSLDQVWKNTMSLFPCTGATTSANFCQANMSGQFMATLDTSASRLHSDWSENWANAALVASIAATPKASVFVKVSLMGTSFVLIFRSPDVS